MSENTDEAPLDAPNCSPSSAQKYENRGGEIWEWDGQKWRELFSSDAIQRIEYYERKIASTERQLNAIIAVMDAIEERYVDGFATYEGWKFMGDAARSILSENVKSPPTGDPASPNSNKDVVAR